VQIGDTLQDAPTSRIAITLLSMWWHGLGDISCAAQSGVVWTVALITIDWKFDRDANAASVSCTHAIVGDAMRPPFATGSIDIVTRSVLHHLDGPAADVIAARAQSRGADWGPPSGLPPAVGLPWPVLVECVLLLALYPVSLHDGVVSILRG
jgi:hypothetical protein